MTLVVFCWSKTNTHENPSIYARYARNEAVSDFEVGAHVAAFYNHPSSRLTQLNLQTETKEEWTVFPM